MNNVTQFAVWLLIVTEDIKCLGCWSMSDSRVDFLIRITKKLLALQLPVEKIKVTAELYKTGKGDTFIRFVEPCSQFQFLAELELVSEQTIESLTEKQRQEVEAAKEIIRKEILRLKLQEERRKTIEAEVTKFINELMNSMDNENDLQLLRTEVPDLVSKLLYQQRKV